jgi:hypothetical protein
MQLAILFTAWQGLSLFIELIIPWLARVAHRRKEASLLREQGLSKAQQKDAHLRHCQARDEFHLHNPDNKGLRYVKLVVQFAYMTLFANTFTLAASMALINNIVQMRVDAYKLVVQSRRPRVQPANGIGLVSKIVNLICFVAIVCNSLILVRSSNSMAQLLTWLEFKVGKTLTETWRYNVCSADARARIVGSYVVSNERYTIPMINNEAKASTNTRYDIVLDEGVCLPLQSFYINNRNGFPPGEEPHEERYTALWAMIIFEHLILSVLVLLETIYSNESAKTSRERKGQAEWLKARRYQAQQSYEQKPENMRGRFAHPELIDILTDTRFIELEMKIAKLERDFNPSTGFIKSSSNTAEETADIEGLVETAQTKKVESGKIKLVTTSNQSQGVKTASIVSNRHGIQKKKNTPAK